MSYSCLAAAPSANAIIAANGPLQVQVSVQDVSYSCLAPAPAADASQTGVAAAAASLTGVARQGTCVRKKRTKKKERKRKKWRKGK